MIGYVWSLVCWYFRPLLKWFLHLTTRMCELQRICYGKASGAPRTLEVENSLRKSRDPDIKRLVARLDEAAAGRGINAKTERGLLEEAIRTVLLAKKINPGAHPDFARSFGKCVELIWGYRQLVVECEDTRMECYDSEDPGHESSLLKLWTLLKPSELLDSRVTKQWQDIGFQGDDPKTDFRGMGILGLKNLVYFAEEYPVAAQRSLQHSSHPRYGYAFAIVGINLTSMTLRLLRDGAAKTHIYNTSKTLPNLRAFHQLYSYLFYEFDAFWMDSKPRNMMEFSAIQSKFETGIRAALSNPSTVFRISVSVENV